MVMNSRTLSTSCNVVNPGTLIPSVLRQLCPKFCIVMNLWTNPTVLPKQYLMLGSNPSFHNITLNLRIHALDLSGKTALFHSLFPRVFEKAQPDYSRRDSTALGIIRTLSSIDRIFLIVLVAETRDFHCYSHVFENLGESDHSEWSRIRLVIQKPSNRRHVSKRIPSRMVSRWSEVFSGSFWCARRI